MNLGQIIYEVERSSKGKCDVIGVNKINTEPITPQEILEKILSVR